jgi:hypothetical protein
MDCAACHLRHAVLATDIPISMGCAVCHLCHAILATGVPISMGSIACQFCHHTLDVGFPIRYDEEMVELAVQTLGCATKSFPTTYFGLPFE